MRPDNLLPLMEAMIEAVWLVDPIELRIISSNRAADLLIGAEPGALNGRPVIDFAASPEDIFFWEDVAAGLSDKIFSETLLRREDGETVQVERRVTRIQYPDEPPLYVVGLRDQTEQRRVEDELEKLIAELRATLESTADGILVVDLKGAIRGYNFRFSELWDLPHEMLTKRDDGSIFAWMIHSVADSTGYAERLGVIANSPLLEATDIIALRSGRVLERVTLPQYARGRPIGRVFSYRDISRRLADDARLQLAAKVFEANPEATFVTDSQFRLIAANPSCERMTGYVLAELLNLKAWDFFSEGCDRICIQSIKDRLTRDTMWQGELWNRRKNGNVFLCMASMVRLQDESGNPLHYIGFLRDMTETQLAHKRIEELAFNDELTGLPNRMLLAERADLTLNQARRSGGTFAILSLDLDRFKNINDSLGHQFGDRVLIEVAERLKGILRSVDTASRLGGDEFVLLLHDTDARNAETTARRVLESLSQPFRIDNLDFTVTCSVGVALYPHDGTTLDELIKNADSAMYHVKERGRSDFRFYQRQMNIDLLTRVKLDHAMRQALEHGDFRLHYQPLLELDSGRIFGAEALIRWHDKEMGNVAPAQFIPVAEETGVIVAIGNWVLREAVRQAAAWHAKGWSLVVAVNVSALQFQQENFVASVGTALREAGLPAHLLEIELTESILIRDAADSLERLQSLAGLGVALSIDDFGTGYSSLGYLKRFPISKLKIDRSFVQDAPTDESDCAIVTAIIKLAHALKLRVIAEGVETEEQHRFLASAECDEYQGFLCSPALESTAFEALHQQNIDT